ncbi:hypothetical protein C2G38_2147412 [Gigaspora rosea]|uniref:SAP domain-containing protein n=1 Tax=Gigaspora rosea TaxID=44941 RepID=A0A397UKR2_9GLOM|nr:hypothetical protein C2G38_2147412 [Gigaspora rosea]
MLTRKFFYQYNYNGTIFQKIKLDLILIFRLYDIRGIKIFARIYLYLHSLLQFLINGEAKIYLYLHSYIPIRIVIVVICYLLLFSRTYVLSSQRKSIFLIYIDYFHNHHIHKMSINPTSLRTKKKSELIKIAEELGLESSGIRNELIDRIRKHLEVKNDEISTDINPIGTSSSRPDPNVSSSDPTTERQITTSPNGERDPDESETSDSDSRQYGIFFTTAGHFDWAEDVRDFIPDNLIYTGAGSAVIFSLYESILSMSRTF